MTGPARKVESPYFSCGFGAFLISPDKWEDDLCRSRARKIATKGEGEMSSKQRNVLFAFGGLVMFCAALAVLGNFLGPYTGTSVTNVAADGLKITISAMVGALSAMLGANK